MTDNELIRSRLAALVEAADQFSLTSAPHLATAERYYADRDALTAAIEDARDALKVTP